MFSQPQSPVGPYLWPSTLLEYNFLSSVKNHCSMIWSALCHCFSYFTGVTGNSQLLKHMSQEWLGRIKTKDRTVEFMYSFHSVAKCSEQEEPIRCWNDTLNWNAQLNCDDYEYFIYLALSVWTGYISRHWKHLFCSRTVRSNTGRDANFNMASCSCKWSTLMSVADSDSYFLDWRNTWYASICVNIFMLVFCLGWMGNIGKEKEKSAT
jgi:hypothetical protein